MSHEEFVLGIINTIDKFGKIKSRERNDLEYVENSEKINNGDIYYRYRGRSEKI